MDLESETSFPWEANIVQPPKTVKFAAKVFIWSNVINFFPQSEIQKKLLSS